MKNLDLCKGNGCPLREKCARYSKKKLKAFYFHPQYNGGDCLLFIPKSCKKGGGERGLNVLFLTQALHTAQKHQGPSCNL